MNPGAAGPTIVIGAGIAGLVVARDLARAGRPVVVLEAGTGYGGAVARHRVGGLDLDAGAESFATATPAVSGLIDDLGLTGRVVAPATSGAWVRWDGGTAPLPAGGLLGIPPSVFSPEVRRVIGRLGTVRAGLDRILPATVGATGGTLGGLVRARLGRRVLERLVEPVAGGVYSTVPDRLSTSAVNPSLLPALARTGSLTAAVRSLRGGSARPGHAVAGLRGGMYELVPALVADITAHGGRIHLGTAATSMGRDGDDWSVRSGAGAISGHRVVVATDGPASVGLLKPWATPTSVTSVTVTPVTLVTLVVDCPALNAHPRGSGVLVCAATRDVTAKALTHATAKWGWLAEIAGPSRHVLRLSYGRGTGEPLPADLAGTAVRDASTLLGTVLPDPADHAITRWDAIVPDPDRVESARRLRAALPPGLSVVGSRLAGTGLAAVVADARAAAARLIDEPQPPSLTQSQVAPGMSG